MSKEYESFSIKNLSCPTCVQGLQERISSLKSVSFVDISFINSTLKVQTTNLDEVKALIKELEPNALLEDIDSNSFKEVKALSFKQKLKNFFNKEVLILLGYIGIYFISLVLLHLYSNDILHYVLNIILVVIYLITGRGVFKATLSSLKNKNFFDENTLMLVATIAAFSIGAFEEAIAVMLFFRAGEILEDKAVSKSKDNLQALLNIAPNDAYKVVGEDIIQVDAKSLNVDDEILIKVGQSVPIDCIITKGDGSLDRSAINGESMPFFAKKGDILDQGSINLTEALKAKVIREYGKSQISQIISLVQDAGLKKAKTEKFITSFARYYTPLIFATCLIIAFVFPFIFGGELKTWVYRALITLMVSCPCAFIISVPMAYFSAIGQLSRIGVLVKGASFIDALSSLKALGFDKTGTLTNAKFSIVESFYFSSLDSKEVLNIIANIEQHSSHPLARVFDEFKTKSLALSDIKEIRGQGISCYLDDKFILVGNESLLKEVNLDGIKDIKTDASRMLLSIDGILIAAFYLNDTLRSSTKSSFFDLSKLGVERLILSGDNELKTSSVAKQLECNYFANLSPKGKEDRFLEFMSKQPQGAKCGFVGDGINDSVVLKRSDVGISMGEKGSDVSVQSSDIILMSDNLDLIPRAIKIAKFTKVIIWQNIILALGVKIGFIALGLGDMANLWEAVFGDVGVSLLVLLNTSRILRA